MTAAYAGRSIWRPAYAGRQTQHQGNPMTQTQTQTHPAAVAAARRPVDLVRGYATGIGRIETRGAKLLVTWQPGDGRISQGFADTRADARRLLSALRRGALS